MEAGCRYPHLCAMKKQASMRAAVYTQYGPPNVVQVKNVPIPSPKHTEVLVRVHYSSVNIADSRLRRADPPAVRLFFGLFGPRLPVLGEVFSGVVESVGTSVAHFKPGDAVFGSTGMKMGAHAEYVCLPESGVLVKKSPNISHIEAATMPFGGAVALHFLRKAGVGAGQKVLIYGASGAVGSAAVQLARHFGAEVTAVCGPTNVDKVRGLGANHVLDYTKEDFTKTGEQFDIVFETVNKTKTADCFSVLKPGGRLILGAAMLREMLQGLWGALISDKKMYAGATFIKLDEIQYLQDLMETGAIKPLLDREFTLDEVTAAHAYVDSGHKKGNVSLRVAAGGA